MEPSRKCDGADGGVEGVLSVGISDPPGHALVLADSRAQDAGSLWQSTQATAGAATPGRGRLSIDTPGLWDDSEGPKSGAGGWVQGGAAAAVGPEGRVGARRRGGAASPFAAAASLGCLELPLRGVIVPTAPVEPTVGIFIGQLPAAYSANDVRGLLRGLGQLRGLVVYVGEVRMHPNHTCAFALVGARARPALLKFHKRVLCDRWRAWVAQDAEQSERLRQLAEGRPAGDCRGLPRGMVVLEEYSRDRRWAASLTYAGTGALPLVAAGGMPAMFPAMPPPLVCATCQHAYAPYTVLAPIACAACLRWIGPHAATLLCKCGIPLCGPCVASLQGMY